MQELLTGIFAIPNHHPKSQPFFDHVFTFSIVDNKVWFRNYQILEETGSLAEIGPRMVLNPIKIFEGSFSGATLWENGNYVTPSAKRSVLRRAKAGKYQDRLQSKAVYEASRPTESTYKVSGGRVLWGSVTCGAQVDETEDVFATIETETEDKVEERPRKLNKPKKKKKTFIP